MKNLTLVSILEKTNNSIIDCKKSGIYKIYHLKYPLIFYIGSASSTRKWREGFLQRWVEHIKHLKNNKHHSKFLQRIVNKYSIDDIRFDILEYCSSENCLKREQYYLDLLKPFGRRGYNTQKTAGSNKGYKIPIEKISRCKKVCKYELDGRFIETFYSMQEAARQCNLNVSDIKECCKKRNKHSGFFIWRYFEETKELDIPSITEIRFYKIACYYEGVLKEITTPKGATILTGLSDCTIYRCIKNNTIYSKSGWLFKKGLGDIPLLIPFSKLKLKT